MSSGDFDGIISNRILDIGLVNRLKYINYDSGGFGGLYFVVGDGLRVVIEQTGEVREARCGRRDGAGWEGARATRYSQVSE